MKVWVVWGTLLLSLALGACQSSNKHGVEITHYYQLKKKCPTLMVMEVGETLEFTVPENPSTGYQWQLLKPLDLFKTEETYQHTEAEEGMVGVGGEKVFRFVAQKPGQELIDLVYVRPWESHQQAEQQWQCRIRVS